MIKLENDKLLIEVISYSGKFGYEVRFESKETESSQRINLSVTAFRAICYVFGGLFYKTDGFDFDSYYADPDSNFIADAKVDCSKLPPELNPFS